MSKPKQRRSQQVLLRWRAAGLNLVVADELEQAERVFPSWPVDPIHAAAIVAEEAGELVQAALQFRYQDGSKEAMRREAIHTIAMGIRFLVELEEKR